MSQKDAEITTVKSNNIDNSASIANNMAYTTKDYIDLLYDLEAGLAHNPAIYSHNIKRENDRSLHIFVRLRNAVELPNIQPIIDKAKLLGKLAVDVQKFPSARILFKTEIDNYVLEDIIVM